MANYANTTYKVISTNNEKLGELYDILQKAMESIDTNSLYNIAKTLNGGTDPNYCRGWINDVTIDGDIVEIFHASAWGENEDFRNAIKQFMGEDCDVYYQSIEHGMDVYTTNDAEKDYFPEHYIVYVSGTATCEEEVFEDFEDVMEYLDLDTDEEICDLDGLQLFLADYEDEDGTRYFVNEFDVIDD